MKKNRRYRKICAAALAGILLAGFCPLQNAEAAPPTYLKAATYVSDAWVSNFWNTESDHMEEELAQIAADGFNSIILVIPWREFQPTMVPIAYNDYAFKKFDKVMRAADNQGLGVELRIGYTWDYYGDDASALRFRELLRDAGAKEAWMDYARKLYQIASAYPCFHGGFITWEDFWNYVEDASGFGTGQYSRDEAKKIGYQSYLKERYTLEELNESYRPSEPFTSYSDVYIPRRSQYAYKLFYEFYDDFLAELLKDTQKVFPNLSMEVRLDVDPVDRKDGLAGKEGVTHYQTFPCGDSSYTSLMYSVSMGHASGQSISAAEAIKTVNEQLAIVRANNEGKPIFIDQLLYMDATENFSHNARLHESHRGPFLTALPDTLRAYTNGYAVWTYRNYTNNPVYNSQFALGIRGWEVSQGTTTERNGSTMMKLRADGEISQKIGHRISGRNTHENHVRFTVDSDAPATVTVTLGRTSRQVEVDGAQEIDINFGEVSYYEVSFRTDGEVYLDNIHVYNFVQDGQLYDLDGNELSCLPSMRALNGAMN